MGIECTTDVCLIMKCAPMPCPGSTASTNMHLPIKACEPIHRTSLSPYFLMFWLYSTLVLIPISPPPNLCTKNTSHCNILCNSDWDYTHADPKIWPKKTMYYTYQPVLPQQYSPYSNGLQFSHSMHYLQDLRDNWNARSDIDIHMRLCFYKRPNIGAFSMNISHLKAYLLASVSLVQKNMDLKSRLVLLCL